MPRKTKDVEIKEKEEKNSKSKKATTKKASTKKASTTKKAVATKKATSKTTSSKKTAEKKAVATKKTTTTKKASANKKTASAKKATPRKKTTSKKVVAKKIEVVEYYDLPYRYNQTIVKVLAQTPTNLFIYWDISDEDREKYKTQFGEDFFNTTKPVLKIYNDTMGYDFEVEINDFANSWYLHVNDSKCDYRVELGRRQINNQNSNYIFISSSNEIESPNDRILFNIDENMVYFKNAKTNVVTTKSVANLAFIRNMGKIYNIYDLYKKLYKDENMDDIYNPSSRFF